LICCTIFDRSRQGALRALVASLRAYHSDVLVLALDIGDGESVEIEGVKIIRLADLPVDRPWIRIALTPWFLRDAVLAGPLIAAALQREDRVLYLSTSMRVVAPLQPLVDALDDHELAFVGMSDRPLPQDERLPSADDVAAGGQVNPRVLAARRSTLVDELVAEWPQSTDRGPGDEAPVELTADPVVRHLDAFATSPSATVLHDAGLGLGYWNLALRPVTGQDGALLAGGLPLRLIDVVGLDEDPGKLWPQQNRVALHSQPELARLLLAFADELRATATDEQPPYLTDARGYYFDSVHRPLLREAFAAGVVDGPPWAPEGAPAWEAFLDEPAEVGAASGITRRQLGIWRSRKDVQQLFPDLDGADGPAFARWLVEEIEEAGRAIEPGDAQATRVLPWGVNVAGFFRSELGLGEAARLLISGLDRAGVPALPIHGAFVPPTRQNAEFSYTKPRQSPYPINIMCLNGDLVPAFSHEVNASFFTDRHTIALWWWEVVDAFPSDWHAAFDYLDEVWVATDQIYDAIAPHSPVPVNKVRMPVLMPRVGLYSRSRLGLPEGGFIFLYVYDYHSTAARKNPVGHVEAFKAAFGEGSGAKLVLKCINGDRMSAEHTRTLLAIDDHPDITVIDRFVSADEKNAIVAACDCYLSLHRSEGFGLTPAEAMALGKPVIATRYGGVLDFMTDQNSYLVDHSWTRVGPGAHPYPPDATWAEPDLAHAARLMREVFEDRAEARRRGERGRRDIREHHDPAVAGAVMRARLQEIHDGLSRAPGQGITVPPTGWNRNVTRQRIETPTPPPAGRARTVKRLLRGSVGRLMAPFLVRQHGVDQHLYDGMVALENRIMEMSHEAADLGEERAQTLATFRSVRAMLEDHQRWLTALETQAAGHIEEHRSLPFMTEPFERWDDPAAGTVEGFRSAAASSDDDAYHDFEQRFRGTRERIAELQRPYVEMLRGREPVLDCGCGRGELLELLRDAGIQASGVDLDEGMLVEARQLGLDVVAGDAVPALAEAPAGAFGAVTAMQVIEHLPERALKEFLGAARHALRPGGRLIVETVNPHSVVALKAFWLDPTHQHPLFPEVVLELCREAGFDQGFVLHPGGQGDVARDRYKITAYAVVADVAG
jgi:glycosyltransferase involved in cell wall biosynthesis/SAM-dependent methyltransferase